MANAHGRPDFTMDPDCVTIIAHRAMPSRGGLAVATSRIAQLAAQRGERVHLVVLSKTAAPGDRVQRERDGVWVHEVGLLSTAADSLAALVDHGHEVAEQTKASLVHGMYATQAGYAATIVAGRLGLPSVVSIRGNDLNHCLYRVQEYPFVAHGLKQATVVTGVTRALCQLASGTFDRKTHFVPNSVDSERFAPQTKDNSLVASLGLGKARVLGYCGELRENKGVRFLLPAFVALCRDHDMRLLLIGGIRHDSKAAFAEFQQTAPEAAGRVHIIDYARSPKQLSRLYALCDLMVFASLREGMPNAVLEAMACARPVLATALGGHLDILEHGKTGALLPTSELAVLPQAILECLDLPAPQRNAMGKAARDYVCAAHQPEQENERWAQVYALARAQGGPAHAQIIEL